MRKIRVSPTSALTPRRYALIALATWILPELIVRIKHAGVLRALILLEGRGSRTIPVLSDVTAQL